MASPERTPCHHGHTRNGGSQTVAILVHQPPGRRITGVCHHSRLAGRAADAVHMSHWGIASHHITQKVPSSTIATVR